MPGATSNLVYACDPWEIDLGRRELRSRGTPVVLGHRAFEIVEALAKAGGELLTKDDLMGRIWPGAIVGDNTLHVHMSAVRKALGPDRGMLKTSSGRGIACSEPGPSGTAGRARCRRPYPRRAISLKSARPPISR